MRMLGKYTSDNSDLAIDIMRVGYFNKEYFKCKAVLYNKKNGIIYENKNYKIFYENIKHWKRLEG